MVGPRLTGCQPAPAAISRSMGDQPPSGPQASCQSPVSPGLLCLSPCNCSSRLGTPASRVTAIQRRSPRPLGRASASAALTTASSWGCQSLSHCSQASFTRVCQRSWRWSPGSGRLRSARSGTKRSRPSSVAMRSIGSSSRRISPANNTSRGWGGGCCSSSGPCKAWPSAPSCPCQSCPWPSLMAKPSPGRRRNTRRR